MDKPQKYEKRSQPLWRRYFNFPLIWKLAIALITGIIAGIIFGEKITVISFLGELLLRLLSMLVLPLIITTLIVGILSTTPKTLGRIGAKIFGFYLVTTLFALIIGLGLATLVSPGQGLTFDETADAEEKEPPELAEVFLNIFPDNIFDALSSGDILAVLFVVLIVGFALSSLLESENDEVRRGAQIIKQILTAAQEIIFKIVRGVLEYSPIGVFALIAVTVGEVGASALLPLIQLTVVAS